MVFQEFARFSGNIDSRTPENAEDLDFRINQDSPNLLRSITSNIRLSNVTSLKDFLTSMERAGFGNMLAGLALRSDLQNDFVRKIFGNRQISRIIEEEMASRKFTEIKEKVKRENPDLTLEEQDIMTRQLLDNVIREIRAKKYGIKPEELELEAISDIRRRTLVRIRPRDIFEVRGQVKQTSASGTTYIRTKPLAFTKNEVSFLKNNIGIRTNKEIFETYQKLFNIPRTKSSIINKLKRLT